MTQRITESINDCHSYSFTKLSSLHTGAICLLHHRCCLLLSIFIDMSAAGFYLTSMCLQSEEQRTEHVALRSTSGGRLDGARVVLAQSVCDVSVLMTERLHG